MRAILWWLAATFVLVQAGRWGQTLRAQDTRSSSLSREAVDDRVYEALQNTIREAVRHYDVDRFSECCAVFQGGLVAVQVFLDSRPELQGAIRRGLADAEQATSNYRRAWVLRRVI